MGWSVSRYGGLVRWVGPWVGRSVGTVDWSLGRYGELVIIVIIIVVVVVVVIVVAAAVVVVVVVVVP